MSRTRRLFFALWPDDTLREALRLATRKAVRYSGGKPVSPANFHVTLKFLGNVDDEDAERLCAATGDIAAGRFTLRLDTLGSWPKPRIFWLGASRTPEALTALARDLDDLAERCCGCDPEGRPYRPHVTLARKVGKPGELGAISPLDWRPESFVLAASETRPDGVRYRVLDSWAINRDL
jgi:2'-5' RNA ligase